MTRICMLAQASLAVLLLAAAPAGAVIGGTPDGNDHPYVGLMVGSVLCSGSLISEDLFVTAGHCASHGDTVGVTVDSAATPGGAFVFGQFNRHPDFCVPCVPGLPGYASNDVAVVELSQPIDVARYADLPAVGLTDGLPPRSSLTVVGYGVQGFHNGPGGRAPFSNRERTQATVTLSPGNFAWSDRFIRISASKAGICLGDSGGPNLDGDTIVAITSYVTNGNCTGNTYSYRLDTTAALDFIGGFLD